MGFEHPMGSRLRLGVAVRRFHTYGGGEKFLGRLLDALPEERFELHLFTSGSPPPGPWTHHRVPTLGWLPWGRFWGFAWAVGRAVARVPVDLLYAHDPILGPVDLFRAGVVATRRTRRRWPPPTPRPVASGRRSGRATG